jgi:hypothetical protein
MRPSVRIAVLLPLLGWAMPAAAATLPARAPGLWQSTTTVRNAAGKPLPNATDVVTVSCVDAANDQKFFLSDANACSGLSITGQGGTYHIAGACRQRGREVRIAETLAYASDQDVTLTAVLPSPTGALTVTSQLQWRGACLPGMRPGDEGSIVNGAFSKADNINDPGDL